jgi:RHS repeat-associated protein
MPEAARIADEIAHSQAGLGHLIGGIAAAVFEGVASFAVGYALAGLACIFPFGTIAAIAIGVAVAVFVVSPAADFIESAGEAIGSTFTNVTGALVQIGSSNVWINKRKAIRASVKMLDYAICSMHSPPNSFVADGAERVWINGARAARKGDGMICDAKISSGSSNVLIGTPSVPVLEKTSLEVSAEQRENIGKARFWSGLIGGAAVGIGKSVPCLLTNLAVGLGMSQATGPLMQRIMPQVDYGRTGGTRAGTAFGNWLQGKPVHVPTGAKILPNEVDAYLPGVFPLVWSRFYNSMDARVGLLGQGWSTPLSFELVFRGGQVIFIGEQGRENPFDDMAPNEARYNIAEQLRISRSHGGHYYASYPGDDLIYYFGQRTTGQDGERLRIVRVSDMRDNGIDFHYNATGLVSEMVLTSGQVVRLKYSSGDFSGLRLLEVVEVVSFADSTDGTNASTRALVSYTYDSAGNLITVADPSGAPVRRFEYDNHMMVVQQFASGLKSHYQWDELNASGRVVKQWSDDGEVLTFEYIDKPLAPDSKANSGLGKFREREVRVTDQLGRLQRFFCDRNFLVSRFVGPLGHETLAEHDPDTNRLIRFTDAEGRVTSFTYDGVGQLAGILNALGQSAIVKWHPKFARVSKVTDYEGNHWFYDYDEWGSLLETRGPNGYNERSLLDERGLVVIHTDAKGGENKYTHNSFGQVTRYTDCSNKSTSYSYDEKNRLSVVTDALGHSITYTFDAAGRLTRASLPDGAQHNYLYAMSGTLIAHTNAEGKGTQFRHSKRGELLEQENASGGKVRLGYDSGFRVVEIINENAQRYRFAHDELDRLIEERRIDGTRITVEYNRASEPIAITHHASLGDDVFEGIERDFENPAFTDSSREATNDSEASAQVRAVRTELIRDALGRLIEKRAPRYHYHYQYDAAGRLIEAKKLSIDSSAMSPTSAPSPSFNLIPVHATTFRYDVLGNLISETASDLCTGETHTVSHTHDELGNRTQTILPAFATKGAKTLERAFNYLFYGSGHLHQINLSQTSVAGTTTGNENASPSDTVHQLIADIERDDLHREILRTQGGLTTRYAHDALGRKTGSWTRASSVLAKPFSAQPGQNTAFAQALAFPSAHEGLLKQYRYDLSGELRERVHTHQGKLTYGYDSSGRIQSALRSSRGGQNTGEQFNYDPAGNLLDTLSRGTTENGSGAREANLGAHANYATQGQRRGFLQDNLVRVFEDKRYIYDGFSRLIEKRVAKHTLQRFDWDDEHRLIAVHTTRLAYAAERKIKKANQSEGAFKNSSETTQSIRFDYDAIGRRVAKHDSFGTTRFIWEGMRLIEERRGSQIVNYVYEPDGYVPLARIDAAGNPTDQGGVGTTAAVERTESEFVVSTRDESSRAVLGKRRVETQHALIAANDHTTSLDALKEQSTVDQKQSEDAGPALANIYYFHTDQVGLPEELSDQNGQIRWRAAYKTWGNTIAERWEAVNLAGEALNERADNPHSDNQALDVQQNLRFQGQYLDRETGLHYNTFRFYDPDIGRFISPDPIGLRGGLNLHQYASNSNAWIDPWGLCSKALGKDLDANGRPNPGNSAAHHLAGDTSARAAPSRAILKKHGIDVDSAENGVWLPNRNNTDLSQPGILHNGRHPNSYVDAVNTRLQNADAAATQAGRNGATPAQQRAIIQSELDAIRNELLTTPRNSPWSTVITP